MINNVFTQQNNQGNNPCAKSIVAFIILIGSGCTGKHPIADVTDIPPATSDPSGVTVEPELPTTGISSVQTAPSEVWTQHYSPDIPYSNLDHNAVNIRAAPSTTAQIKGRLTHREGGFIKGCTEDLEWCLISYGGKGATGWVYISLLGGVAH